MHKDMHKGILEKALKANAGFSLATGLIAVALAGRFEESLGPPAWSLRALGAGLLVFAALVAREARAPEPTGSQQIIAADLAWVVAAAIIVAVSPDWLTGTGRVVLGVVSALVAVLAAAQWRGLAEFRE